MQVNLSLAKLNTFIYRPHTEKTKKKTIHAVIYIFRHLQSRCFSLSLNWKIFSLFVYSPPPFLFYFMQPDRSPLVMVWQYVYLTISWKRRRMTYFKFPVYIIYGSFSWKLVKTVTDFIEGKISVWFFIYFYVVIWKWKVDISCVHKNWWGDRNLVNCASCYVIGQCLKLQKTPEMHEVSSVASLTLAFFLN